MSHRIKSLRWKLLLAASVIVGLVAFFTDSGGIGMSIVMAACLTATTAGVALLLGRLRPKVQDDPTPPLSPRTAQSLLWSLAIAASLTLVFQCDIQESLLGMLVLVLGWPVGLSASTLLCFDALAARRRGLASSHLWGALALAILLGPAISFTRHATLWISASQKLLRHRSGYAEAVDIADAGGNRSAIYDTIDGPPPVYFFLWGGAASHRDGIMHDRTESAVETPEAFCGRHTGGQFVHLWGPWYYVAY